MKKTKIILLFILVLIIIGKPHLKASNNFWDYYPLGINYLDPDNINVSNGVNQCSFSINNYIKVKPSTSYTLVIVYSHDVSFEDYEVYGYDYEYNDVDEITIITSGQDLIQFITGSTTDYIDGTFNFFGLDYTIENVDQEFFLCETNSLPENLTISYPFSGYDDDKKPVITGYNGLYVTNINNPVSIDAIKNGIIAIDGVDGNVTNTIDIYEDNYSDCINTIGTKDVIFEAHDSSGNYSYFKLYIDIVDTTAPIINGINNYNTNQVTPISDNTIKNNLIVTDNYEAIGNIILNEVSNTYRSNSSIVGTYKIVYEAIDSSNNRSTYEITITVSDGVPPVIIGANSINSGTKDHLTVMDIKSTLTATDDVDNDVTSSIIIIADNYSENINKVGSYNIVFEAKDSSNNKVQFTITVNITDNVGPLFFIDTTTINIDLNKEMLSIQQLVTVIRRNKKIPETTEIEIITDEYTPNCNQAGKYIVELEIEEEILRLEINIIEDLYSSLEVSKENVFTKIINFIKNLFYNIGKFFVNGFKIIFKI